MTASVIFSNAAAKKIEEERERQSHASSAVAIPRIDHYHRSYMTYTDGSTEEFGPGLLLSFAAINDQDCGCYVNVQPSDSRVYVSPQSYFSEGVHIIDWDGRKFVIAKSEQ